MSKFIKCLILILLAYILPLIFKPELLLHYKIIILAVASVVMLLTQPDFSPDDAKEKKKSDQGSVILILLAGLVSQILPIIEWGYADFGYENGSNIIFTTIGIGLIIGGLAFRIWSIRVLGKYFTATVQIVDNHQIIKSGPYAIVRHPSYLGAYMAIVGSAIFLNSLLGALIAATLMFIAYKKRIAAEENVLINQFGDEYLSYINSTPGIIPLYFQ